MKTTKVKKTRMRVWEFELHSPSILLPPHPTLTCNFFFSELKECFLTNKIFFVEFRSSLKNPRPERIQQNFNQHIYLENKLVGKTWYYVIIQFLSPTKKMVKFYKNLEVNLKNDPAYQGLNTNLKRKFKILDVCYRIFPFTLFYLCRKMRKILLRISLLTNRKLL